MGSGSAVVGAVDGGGGGEGRAAELQGSNSGNAGPGTLEAELAGVCARVWVYACACDRFEKCVRDALKP